MTKLSLHTVAVFAVALLLAEAPWLRPMFGGHTGSEGDMRFISTARAQTSEEKGIETVRCVLPGQIRPLGSTTYVTRGRTIETTRKECETRGGRLVAPSEPAEEDNREPPKSDETTD